MSGVKKSLFVEKDFQVEETDNNITITVSKEHFEKAAPKGTREALDFVKKYGQDFVNETAKLYEGKEEKELYGQCHLGYEDDDVLEIQTIKDEDKIIVGTQTTPTYMTYDLGLFYKEEDKEK